MSIQPIGPMRKAWLRWKMLRLPWRKRFLVGLDLQGNTYWEFRIRGDNSVQGAGGRWRRIVEYARGTHYSDVKVPPQWHQWLRYQRERVPSLNEQAADVARQERLKVLAAEADARWEAKPSLLDHPGQAKGQPVPPLNTEKTQPQEQRAVKEGQEKEEETAAQKERQTPTTPKDDPWKRARGGPSEGWQPEAWTPTAARKR
ncbi:hypothetical protein F4780DRAFT_783351 [Xylariomycetidae sp. FL0641]|nr:hypothetical protein F4780DRAFT_783351 [Xylariomycetidae sp. FL0641]